MNELLPWAGYAIYNRSTETQRSIELRSLEKNQSLVKRLEDLPGWRLQLRAMGETYSDVGNYLGRIEGAAEGRDRFDNPEPPFIDGYVSLILSVPEQDASRHYSSDIRSLEIENGVWNIDLHTKGEKGTISLFSELHGETAADFQVAIVDIVTRDVTKPLAETEPILIRDHREEFPYHLKAVTGSQAWVDATVNEILEALPKEFALSQNYPNPFNPITTIRYTMPRPEKVALIIYNILGQEVVTLVNKWQDLGEYEVVWNSRDRSGRELSSGIYFARLSAPGVSRTIKMVLLK